MCMSLEMDLEKFLLKKGGVEVTTFWQCLSGMFVAAVKALTCCQTGVYSAHPHITYALGHIPKRIFFLHPWYVQIKQFLETQGSEFYTPTVTSLAYLDFFLDDHHS